MMTPQFNNLLVKMFHLWRNGFVVISSLRMAAFVADIGLHENNSYVQMSMHSFAITGFSKSSGYDNLRNAEDISKMCNIKKNLFSSLCYSHRLYYSSSSFNSPPALRLSLTLLPCLICLFCSSTMCNYKATSFFLCLFSPFFPSFFLYFR